MTARKHETWIFPEREPNGMTSTGALEHVEPVYGNTPEEEAAVIWHIDRLATDARDADRLKRALGLTATHPTLKETHK